MKRNFQVFISFLNILLLFQPFLSADPSIESNETCKEEVKCCESSWGETALILGGAIMAGGVVGAIVGNKGHHHHHDSSSHQSGILGPTGSTGIAGATGGSSFDNDPTATLIFTANIFIDSSNLSALQVDLQGNSTNVPGNGTFDIIPFVSTPDGLIITSQNIVTASFDASGSGTTGVISLSGPLTVTVPEGLVVFGTYHFGLEMEDVVLPSVPGPGITGVILIPPTIPITASVMVNNVKEGTEEISLDNISLPQNIDLLASELQGETEYSYDPDQPNGP